MVEVAKKLVFKQFKFPENDDCNEQARSNYFFINFVLKLSGMNMYSDDFSIFNPILMITLTNVVVYLLVNTYAVHHFWGDFLKVAYCVVPMGCGFQFVGKLYICFTKTEAIKTMYHDSLDIVKNPDNEIIRKSQLLYLRWYHITARFVTFLAVCIGSTVVFQPFFEAIITGKRMLPFGFFVPLLEPYGDPGYYVNWGYQLVMIYITPSILLGTLLISVSLLFNVYMQINSLMLMLDRLDGLCLQVGPQKDPGKLKEISEYLKKIIALHQKNIIFMNKINAIFDVHALINISAMVFQMLVSLLAIVSDPEWTVGYMIIVMDLVQLFWECLVGTVLYTYNDKLVEKIYDISWHEMSIPDQKSMVLMLQNAQQPKELSFKFGTVDLKLFVEIVKTVYSFFMMLMNFN